MDLGCWLNIISLCCRCPTKANMITKAILILILITVVTVSCYRRRNANMPDQIRKMQDLLNEAKEYIDVDTTEDARNTTRIQTAANNFCYYMEEATNTILDAINLIKDPAGQKLANDFVDFGMKSTYNIEKNLNKGDRELKKALKDTLSGYAVVVEKALGFFPKSDVADNEMLRIINAAREAFDITLFNFEFILTQLKYYNVHVPKVLESISTQLEKIYNFLNGITTNNNQLTGELSVYIHHLSRPIDILLRKIERLAYNYQSDKKSAATINQIVINLTDNLSKLRKSTKASTETQSLAKDLKEYFESSAALVKNLSEIENKAGASATDEALDAVKSIALEVLAIVTTFNDNIELFKTKSD